MLVQQFLDFSRGQAVLAQMHSSCACGKCNIHPVVDKDRRDASYAQDCLLHKIRQFPARQILLPNLNPVHTSLCGLFYFLKRKIHCGAVRGGKAPAIRHIAKQRLMGWWKGAHGPVPDAN